jgi:endonuclease/exonuclease/phosphatase family metal-dependent hydrolase
MQELAPEQARAIEAVLPFGKLEPARDSTGMGIALSRPGNVWRLPLACRGAYVAEVSMGDLSDTSESVEVVNVHILAPHLTPIWQTFRGRREQLRGLEEYLQASPGRARAIVGDFNATPIWPVYRRLARRLTDAAIAASRNGRRPKRTWAPWPQCPRLFRIDHAMVNGITVHDCRVVHLVGGDHSALVADLELPD